MSLKGLRGTIRPIQATVLFSPFLFSRHNGWASTIRKYRSRELSNDILSSVLYEGRVYGFDLKQLQASKHLSLIHI